MNETELRVMELAAQGFCCSQIMLILALEAQGRENAELIRAVNGLCKGMGRMDEACGVMSGGACLMALYAGKGAPEEERHERYPELLDAFTSWFKEEACSGFCGTRCIDIVGEEGPAPKPGVCGKLVAQAFDKAVAILAENGLDPSQPKEGQNV